LFYSGLSTWPKCKSISVFVLSDEPNPREVSVHSIPNHGHGLGYASRNQALTVPEPSHHKKISTPRTLIRASLAGDVSARYGVESDPPSTMSALKDVMTDDQVASTLLEDDFVKGLVFSKSPKSFSTLETNTACIYGAQFGARLRTPSANADGVNNIVAGANGYLPSSGTYSEPIV